MTVKAPSPTVECQYYGFPVPVEACSCKVLGERLAICGGPTDDDGDTRVEDGVIIKGPRS